MAGEINNVGGLDVDALINNVAADFSKGDIEDKKVAEARVNIRSRHIRDKRQERIDNLKDQMKGPSGPKGCMKVLKVVFKIIDFLSKPLSLITMKQLNVDLSKALDQLQNAKNQQKLTGLKIDGQQILKSLQGFKTLLSDDMEQLKTRDAEGAKETERVLRILDDIHDTFKATNQI